MSSIIKSLLGMSMSDTSSSTSSSSTTSLADQPTISAPPLIEVQSSQSEETIVNPASTTIIDTEVVEAKADEIDEEAIKEAVREYGEMERLAPLRTKQILKKALKPAPPAAPDPSECCGSSCVPCVKDLWREEVRVWKIARGIDPYALSDPSSKGDLDW